MNEKQTEIQLEAFNAWVAKGRKGTVELATGVGKTRIFMMAVKELPLDSKILFLAETTTREQDLRDEQKKWSCEDYTIEFACYQSAYKWSGKHWDLVGADEVHDSLTLEYSKFYLNNTYDRILAMSATIPVGEYLDDETKELSKREFVRKMAPICYTYTLEQGIEDGIVAPYKLLVINLRLDSVNKSILGGTKNNPFYQTEAQAYAYRSQKFENSKRLPAAMREFAIRSSSAARAKLLYDLPSKINSTKKLLEGIKTKRVVLFGNSLNSLLQVTPEVISSRYSEPKNKQIREDFNNGKINVIGSFKKLKQGANLKNADTAVIMSYYSKSKDYIQRAGRVLRFSPGKFSYIIVLRTLGTQEMTWYDKMKEEVDESRVMQFDSVEACVNYINDL